MSKLRIVLSCLVLSFSLAACDVQPDGAAADDVASGIGTSPTSDEPVSSETDELRIECSATYQCGTVTAPRECCRCWEMVPCDFGVDRCTFCSF